MELAKLRMQIETLARARGSLDALEDLLEDTLGLSQDEHAALWLYGWSLVPNADQQREALRMLAVLSG